MIVLYKTSKKKWFFSTRIKRLTNIQDAAIVLMKNLAILLFGFFLFIQPFNMFFEPFVSGIGVLCAPQWLIDMEKLGPLLFEADHCQQSALWQLAILHGHFYFFVISLLVFLFLKKKYNIQESDIFVLILILLSTILILVPEFLYAKDIYPAHYRANTMFKLVYQAFIMLGIVSAYTMAIIIKKSRFLPFHLLSVLLVGLILTYPYFAITSFYGKLGSNTYEGLDGTMYLKKERLGDYEAIQFLNARVEGQPIILEAQGDSYTDYGRISVNTGLPTVLGWTVHEWLWRGSYDVPQPRIDDVRSMYEDPLPVAEALLKQYNVEYIVVGSLERQKYPNITDQKFNQIGKIIFISSDGQTTIYKIDN